MTPTREVDSPWMTVTEAGTYARLENPRIYEALKNKALVGHRRGKNGHWRIHREDLDAWIRGEQVAS